MKRTLLSLLTCLSVAGLCAANDTLRVENLKIAGPYTAQPAVRLDSIDVKGAAINNDALLTEGVLPQLWKSGQESSQAILGGLPTNALYQLGFVVENNRFAKCAIEVKGSTSSMIFIDNRMSPHAHLLPGRHEVVIQVLCQADKKDTVTVNLISEQGKYLSINPTGKRIYTLEDYMTGEKASSTALSADGRYLMMNTYSTNERGKVEWKRTLLNLKTRQSTLVTDFKEWASQGSRYISSQTGTKDEVIYAYVDPATGAREVFFTDYGARQGSFLPNEKEMIVYKYEDGPAEDKQIYQILEPDDRQPGWRRRSNVQLLNVQNGQLSRLTVGYHNTDVSLSRDGRKVLIFNRTHDITQRPFTFTSVYLYNRDTQQLDTLVQKDGFVSTGSFTADGNSVIFQGSPEAFGGIGKNDPTGKIPSMIQQELFHMDLASKQVKSLTYDFNPSIVNWQMCDQDGCLYALCENRDRHDIFRLNLKTGKITQLPLSENYISSFSLANGRAMLSYTGQSESNASRVYTVDLKTGKETLVKDWNETRMGDIQLGKCEDWYFVNSKGDSICGRYYLPPHFDANKQYPMLVYYYGGCSPTGRVLESYYNYHGWAAMGYVVYVIQPSGCTGFGQEFAARHVNTYGEGTAEDIIEGTKQFCAEHPYVNPKKIGCLGASYGGFMTQYLLTKTDIFAAAMSHAGISNPASYWGFGYWGYSYSAVSAAHSYPWNNEKLFTRQAPLFNADKVHTPLLFLHGASDTNVPINESIQMFTALKILGRETAFVAVDGQDHHITDFEKQKKWVSTYYAWFAKWLQDDSTWWDTLYPKKNL